jgi:hypothetical protein
MDFCSRTRSISSKPKEVRLDLGESEFMKNIVICCDGTNNQLETDQTNVFRLFLSLQDDPNLQIVYYDPGVGTLAQSSLTSKIGKKISLVYGLAFGLGFTRNLEEAYTFLMQNYIRGDQLFMFGFSRGAYTVRALAGMLHMFGLLDKDQENLVPYLSRAYLSANFEVAEKVKKVSRRDVCIEFLGLWDTVTSLGFAYKRKALPYTANNSSVRVVRHAMSIDERRSYFRQNRWDGQFAAHQNIKQVWFAGVHSDVGGGYPEGDPRDGSANNRSALSKITLQWMVEEAKKFNLQVDDSNYQKQLQGKFPAPFQPNAGAVANESLRWFWWIVEFLPMNYTLRHNSFRLPSVGRRRKIPVGSIVHQSVIDRVTAGNYKPPNLPTPGSFEPWSAGPGQILTPAQQSAWSKLPRYVGERLLGFLGALTLVHILAFAIVLVLRMLLEGGFRSGVSQTLWSTFLWPTWLSDQENIKRLGPILVPLAVFMIGSWLLGKLSGLPRCEVRIKNGKILHQRFGGYNKTVAEEQLHQLHEDGRVAYLRMLKLDLAFPLFYGAALIWGLHAARTQTGFSSFSWIELLPPVTMVSDWAENILLLWQVSRYRDTEASGLTGWAIGVASVATTAKLLTFTGVLLWIIWLLVCALRET